MNSMLPQWVEPSPLTQNESPAAASQAAVPATPGHIAQRPPLAFAQENCTAWPAWPATSDSAQPSAGGVTVSASKLSSGVEAASAATASSASRNGDDRRMGTSGGVGDGRGRDATMVA